MRCQWHPETETYATCLRCEAPICYRCQVRSDVGFLCPIHGKNVPLPQNLVSFTSYLRAAAIAVVLGIIGGFILRLIAAHLWWAPVMLILLLGGLGYLLGETVSWAAKRKRSRGLQLLLLVGVLLAVVIGFGTKIFATTILIGISIAVAISFSRLR